MKLGTTNFECGPSDTAVLQNLQHAYIIRLKLKIYLEFRFGRLLLFSNQIWQHVKTNLLRVVANDTTLV